MPPDDPGNPTVDYRGEKRSNETHESKSDPEAQMARKGAGKEGKLSYRENLLVKNRNGLIVGQLGVGIHGPALRDSIIHPGNICGSAPYLKSHCPRRPELSLGREK